MLHRGAGSCVSFQFNSGPRSVTLFPEPTAEGIPATDCAYGCLVRVDNMKSILAGAAGAICSLTLAVPAPGAEISKVNFRLSYDERGITGLANPQDPYGAELLQRGQRLGLTVTKAKIESIEAEFPKETRIARLGELRRGVRVYEVAFKRLGENRLTIHHDGGRKTYLEYFVTEPLETLIKKRASFIVNLFGFPKWQIY